MRSTIIIEMYESLKADNPGSFDHVTEDKFKKILCRHLEYMYNLPTINIEHEKANDNEQIN
jgi:hypothetical protein